MKRYQGRAVIWPEIECDLAHAGEARFCYVSVFGFTSEARDCAAAAEVTLLEAADFTRSSWAASLPELKEKLKLPADL